MSSVCLPQWGHIWAILDACDSTLWVKECDQFTPLAPYWPGHRSPLYIPSLPACWRDLWLCLKKRKTSCQKIQGKNKRGNPVIRKLLKAGCAWTWTISRIRLYPLWIQLTTDDADNTIRPFLFVLLYECLSWKVPRQDPVCFCCWKTCLNLD